MGRDTIVIVAAGGLMLALAFGVRSIFGVVLDPLSEAQGWSREVFSFSLALQNIMWGLAQPFFGAMADRLGDRRALTLGFLCYVAGMGLSVLWISPLSMHLGVGLLVGAGIAGTGFGIVLPVVGRAVPEARRSAALGITASLGSLGQVALPLLAGWTTSQFGWFATMVVFALLLAPMAACIPFLKAEIPASDREPGAPLATGPLLARAFGHQSYLLLTLGFFVCGFHVAFITAHLPAYVVETCGSVALGAASIAIIGAGNVAGTLAAGWMGGFWPKPYLLSAIYALRAAVILLFIFVLPVTPASIVAFSMLMGLLWLSTVPLTSALVATMFGPRYMGTLYGVVFLSHQVGAFVGVWLGGVAYALYGNYDTVWWLAIGLGILSALVHLPVKERRWQAA